MAALRSGGGMGGPCSWLSPVAHRQRPWQLVQRKQLGCCFSTNLHSPLRKARRPMSSMSPTSTHSICLTCFCLHALTMMTCAEDWNDASLMLLQRMFGDVSVSQEVHQVQKVFEWLWSLISAPVLTEVCQLNRKQSSPVVELFTLHSVSTNLQAEQSPHGSDGCVKRAGTVMWIWSMWIRSFFGNEFIHIICIFAEDDSCRHLRFTTKTVKNKMIVEASQTDDRAEDAASRPALVPKFRHT